MMFLALLMFLSMAFSVQGDTECYNMGCVTDDPPYKSQTRNSTFPQSPESINTRFLLFTVNNSDYYQVISNRNLSRDLQESHYDCRRNSVFIIHGYMERDDDPWVIDTCQKILEVEDVNCLCVEWNGGARGDYFQAISNVQVVGAEIAFFIKMTVENCGCSLSRIHLIGHCVGAHVAGEAGKRRPGIGRITCLDAARPGFEGESDEVSVDRTDALFVVAIHTDAGLHGVGMTTLIGHKDFFPNGGELMTECNPSFHNSWQYSVESTVEDREVFVCNHIASHYMFTASLHNPGGLMGYCASNYKSFEEGAGFPCSNGSCSMMGYYTEPGDASSCRTYYLSTGPRSNYKRWRFNVTAEIKDTSNMYGCLTFSLNNCSGTTLRHRIYSLRETIKGSGSFSALIDLFSIESRETFYFLNYICPAETLQLTFVTMLSGIDGSERELCLVEKIKGSHCYALRLC